ncbi:MAG: diguanylate cyclase [Candidatus Acidiferrales bacterium]
MSTLAESVTDRGQLASVPRDAATHRHPAWRILFVHRDAAEVARCLHELNRAQFPVSADIATNPGQVAELLDARPYDVVVAECPGSDREGAQALGLVCDTKKHIPFIFLTETLQRETVAELTMKGAADCVEKDRIGRLPLAIRRALDERSLRDERDRAEKDLRHSEARYHALVTNLAYGVCRCSPKGTFLSVNQALVAMLGYSSREEFLAVNLACDIFQDPDRRAQLLGQPGDGEQTDPLETEWKRKDGSIVKVRLSGREVSLGHGEHDSYEIIVEDVTKQRLLEEHLRLQAARDPLTGLSNYRRLADVLDAEIKRSERTGREFALLLFDMDGLKRINDHHGHLVGSQALCRLADVLGNCSRSIDTAARFGGDEFALILPETGVQAAHHVARRIRQSLANDGQEPRLSLSLGIATYPEDGRTIETLLHAADCALYKMKGEQSHPLSVGSSR